MTVWRKHVDEPFFGYLNLGIKTIEGRLYRDDWTQMKIDDVIVFYNEAVEVPFKIIGLHREESFTRLSEQFGQKLLPYEQPSIYYYYFSPEDESKYGVIGVEVNII